MKLNTLIFLVLIFCITLPAYAEHDEEFFNKVRASNILDNEESVLLSSNVYFYPNKRGHGLFSGGKGREKGHIIFTENGFYVISWDRGEKAYEILYQQDYSDVVKTEVSGNSPMVRLVTQSGVSGKFNSYELMDSRNALTPNVNKTKQAHKIVSAGINGHDVTKVATAKDLSVAEAMVQQERLQELEKRIQRLEKINSAEKSIKQECDCKCEN